MKLLKLKHILYRPEQLVFVWLTVNLSHTSLESLGTLILGQFIVWILFHSRHWKIILGLVNVGAACDRYGSRQGACPDSFTCIAHLVFGAFYTMEHSSRIVRVTKSTPNVLS